MRNITVILLVFAGVIITAVLTKAYTPEKITYVNEVKEQSELIAERTMSIYNSQEFQQEVMQLATARALFEMSNETQSNAVELSEMAVMSYEKSQLMAEDWHNLQ